MSTFVEIFFIFDKRYIRLAQHLFLPSSRSEFKFFYRMVIGEAILAWKLKVYIFLPLKCVATYLSRYPSFTQESASSVDGIINTFLINM